MSRDAGRALLGAGAVLALTILYTRWLGVHNSTTAALTFLMVVLVVAATSHLWAAVATSVVAVLCFNFFFLPPVGTFTIVDPQNWIALFAFLAVSLVASNLSSVARARAEEATTRRDEVARLFDLSRDVLLITESREANAALAALIARRFELDYVAICLPRGGDWDIAEAGTEPLTLDNRDLSRAMVGVEAGLEFDLATQTYAGNRTTEAGGRTVKLVPLRLGARAVGLLATTGRPLDPGTLDAVGGVAAIAIERALLLEEKKAAELARQSEQLKSALLASLGHDLRTPLTAIRVAAGNLQSSWLTEQDRREQAELVLSEVGRLTRLFQNILEMARIDSGTIGKDLRWVHPSEIVEAARDQVGHTLGQHRLVVDIATDQVVHVDPRLTAAALGHLLENAAQYAPGDTPISVRAETTPEGLLIAVRDSGPGIAPQDLPHLFERFYRGAAAKSRASGTGMGLSIARGLLAVERGRIWATNHPEGGAQFTIVVPADTRTAEIAEQAV
jgi:two-component system sensor histidine kinase KdpD